MFSKKIWSIALFWGLVAIFTSVFWSVLGHLLGVDDEKIAYFPLFNVLIIIPMFIIYFLAIRNVNKEFQPAMTYWQKVLSGLMLTIVITILGPIPPLISAFAISPNLFSNSIQYVVDQKMMTLEQAAQQFNLISFIVQGLIGAPISGLVLSLVASLIVRKRPE